MIKLDVKSLAFKDRVSPPLRSSDALGMQSPFLYYLIRRLGITSAFPADALNYGKWAHRRWQLHNKEYGTQKVIVEALSLANTEVAAACKKFSFTPDQTKLKIEDTIRIATMACAMYEGAATVKTPGGSLRDGFESYMNDYEILATEALGVVYTDKAPVARVAQFDELMFDTRTNKVWILDLKTTAKIPADYAKVCSKTFQTIHYMIVLEYLIKTGELNKAFPGLPPKGDLELGGMTHLIIQKPTIRFGPKYRKISWYAASKRTNIEGWIEKYGREYRLTTQNIGRRVPTATIYPDFTEVEAEFKHVVGVKPKEVRSGEPDYGLYVEAVKEWYKTPDIIGPKCPVLLSTTRWDLITTETLASYFGQCAQLFDLGSASPENHAVFPALTDYHLRDRTPSAYLDFYHLPVMAWEEIMRCRQLVIRHRDLELDDIEESCIILQENQNE